MRFLLIDSKSYVGVYKRMYILFEEIIIDIVFVVNKYGGGYYLIINFLIKCIIFLVLVDWCIFVNDVFVFVNFCILLFIKL